MKNIFIIAFNYPPSNSASTYRILKLTEFLANYAWNTHVLTVYPSVYDIVDTEIKVPSAVNVSRVKCLDIDRHLSYRGKHFSWMKAVDRWTSWVPIAVRRGSRMIKSNNIDLIMSTSPIPSAHVVGGLLARKFNIPWVADYQDPFPHLYREEPQLRRYLLRKIDSLVVRNAYAATFATQQAADLYQKVYSEIGLCRYVCIENGFDNDVFDSFDLNIRSPLFSHEKFSLYYSGILYSPGRNPLPLFSAISNLAREKKITPDNFELIFQGSGSGAEYKSKLADLGISELVRFEGGVDFRQSLINMKCSDSLVLIQDKTFNLQIPGKLFEYIRSFRPILALTDENGATCGVISSLKNGFLCHSVEDIERNILKIMFGPDILPLSLEEVNQYSRYSKSMQFLNLFETILLGEK